MTFIRMRAQSFEWVLAVVLVVAGVLIWRSASNSIAVAGTDAAAVKGGDNACGGQGGD